MKKRHPRRKIMIKRNAGRNTIIAVQSIKSIHHPDNNRIQKRSLLMGEKGRLVNTRAQTMMCNPVQKMNLVERKAKVIRVATINFSEKLLCDRFRWFKKFKLEKVAGISPKN